MMANLGFLGLRLRTVFFYMYSCVGLKHACMYKMYLGGTTDFRVFGNIEPKLTKSRPGTTTTHEGWMDKWVDGCFIVF